MKAIDYDKYRESTPGLWRVGDARHTVFGPRTEAVTPETIAAPNRTCNSALIADAPMLL